MPEGRQIPRHGEAIVLRTWPFHEADLLVSLFTRDQGRVKGVARHAMRSRKRFGGALEPATHVRAHYTERPRQELVRLDQFEVLWSPLTAPIDYARTAALQLVVEVLEEALPELAPDDNIFRLALTTLTAMQAGPLASGQLASEDKNPTPGRPIHRAASGAMSGEPQTPAMGLQTPAPGRMSGQTPASANIYLPITYFCLWMNRLMGWMPDLGHCAACGLHLGDPELRGQPAYWSPTADGVTCGDDRRPGSRALSAASVAESHRIARAPLSDLASEDWPKQRSADLRAFAIAVLERHLERRLRSAAALGV